MSGFQPKIIRHAKRHRAQTAETKQVSDTDSDKTGILELLDREFKITMISMLRALMEMLENIHKKMGKMNIEMRTLNKNQNSRNQKYFNRNEDYFDRF